MKIHSAFILLFTFFLWNSKAQDTFSIVAADSTTREVGSAGASCVDLFAAGFSDATFIGDLLPDTGAINTQAFYLKANQDNARARMRLGETPSEVINWLAGHDVADNPDIRQYGVVGFTGNNVSAAGYTGDQTNSYTNHRTGSINGIYYSIQGNILKGVEVIDSMEARFRNANGDLACRLMEALQGAKMVGADTRCTSDGTSSLFAYVKVAQPTDSYESPSFKISVRTHDNSRIEPIDSLQSIFDTQHNCSVTGTDETSVKNFVVFPNPAQNTIFFIVDESVIGEKYGIYGPSGKLALSGWILAESCSIDIRMLPPGLYIIRIPGLPPQNFWKS